MIMTLPSISLPHSETSCILFHPADPDFRPPHLLNTREGGTRVLRWGVPAFYDKNGDDDSIIVALLREDVVIVTLL
jgi:hypothetical protein